jgi:hypothetical protein
VNIDQRRGGKIIKNLRKIITEHQKQRKRSEMNIETTKFFLRFANTAPQLRLDKFTFPSQFSTFKQTFLVLLQQTHLFTQITISA